MSFKIKIRSEENDKLDGVVIDIITSAAFFQRKNVDIQQEREEFTFMFQGHCPNEYLAYLSDKYDLSLDYVSG